MGIDLLFFQSSDQHFSPTTPTKGPGRQRGGRAGLSPEPAGSSTIYLLTYSYSSTPLSLCLQTPGLLPSPAQPSPALTAGASGCGLGSSQPCRAEILPGLGAAPNTLWGMLFGYSRLPPQGKNNRPQKGGPWGPGRTRRPTCSRRSPGEAEQCRAGGLPPQTSDGGGRGDCVRPPRDCGTTPSPPGATGAHDSRGGEGGGHETWRNGAPWWPRASARLWLRNRWHPRAVAMGLPWILSPLLPWRKEEAGSGGAAARATRTSPRPRTEELGARQGSDSISCPS